MSIEGIGSVDAQTDANGVGSITVEPAETRDYVLSAEAEEQTDTATIGVLIRPSGQSFAMIDIGATGGRVEPGAVNGRTIGGAANNTSGDLFETELLSDTGDFFTLSLDSVAPDDFPLGTLDWRDRGDGPTLPLNRLGEDFVKNNSGMIRVTLGQLPAGTYEVISYHADSDFSQSDNIRILVTDANGVAADTMVTGDASWEGHPENTGAPAFANLTTGDVSRQEARFQITANGTDPVIIYFDGSLAGLDTETPLSGLWLSQTGPRPVDNAWALIDIGADSGQLEPGSAGTAVVGAGIGVNGTNHGPVELVSRTGVPFSITLDNVDPTDTPVGGLDWRDRGDAADVPLARFAEDFVKNNAGIIRARLAGLPAGAWEIISFHNDPTLSQSEQIKLIVTDADRTGQDTGVVADASFLEGDAGAPQINGLSTGFVNFRTGRITVRSNGTDDILLYYDGTQSLDLEVPLNGLRIASSSPVVPPQIIAVNDVTYTATGATAAVSISFASEPGSTYSVFASPDPGAWGAALTTNLAATGSTTIFTESNIPTTITRRFYQIRRNPNP